jgi:predicted ABC-type ATPase
MSSDAPHLILISGPVGVGKTTVAQEMSNQLAETGVAHTFVDLDALTYTYPRRDDDPYGQNLALKNLQAVWANAQIYYPRVLIIARVIETAAGALEIADTVNASECTIVRLEAQDETLLNRVHQREQGAGHAWHEARALELSQSLSETDFANLVLGTDDRSVGDIANEIIRGLQLNSQSKPNKL